MRYLAPMPRRVRPRRRCKGVRRGWCEIGWPSAARVDVRGPAAPPEWLVKRSDKFGADANVLKSVDHIAWDSLRIGRGKRTRRRGDNLLVLQKPPIGARTWRDHGISNRWSEKVDRRVHAHVKPIGLISRLIAAVTEPGDLVIDPAAGSFVVMKAARQLGRDFVGCDWEWRGAGLLSG